MTKHQKILSWIKTNSNSDTHLTLKFTSESSSRVGVQPFFKSEDEEKPVEKNRGAIFAPDWQQWYMYEVVHIIVNLLIASHFLFIHFQHLRIGVFKAYTKFLACIHFFANIQSMRNHVSTETIARWSICKDKVSSQLQWFEYSLAYSSNKTPKNSHLLNKHKQ